MAFKSTFMNLCAVLMKSYLGIDMEIETLIDSVLTLPGERVTTATTETVRIFRQPRGGGDDRPPHAGASTGPVGAAAGHPTFTARSSLFWRASCLPGDPKRVCARGVCLPPWRSCPPPPLVDERQHDGSKRRRRFFADTRYCDSINESRGLVGRNIGDTKVEGGREPRGRGRRGSHIRRPACAGARIRGSFCSRLNRCALAVCVPRHAVQIS